MGLASTTTNENILLCVFDMQRGQEEGQEIDKILFFFPLESAYSKQLSVVGLSEGLITFTRIFSPDAACEVIEAEKHTHILYQAESDIWMVMVVEKSAEAIWRSSALQAVLKEVHNLFLMFHGPVRALLDKQPSGVYARNHLHFFISDYLNDFLLGKKYQMPSFRDCLKERGMIQMLTMERELAIEVQSLVTALEMSFMGRSTSKSLILFQDLLVSSTLPPDDTTNLFTYSVMRLTPHALSSATNIRSYLGKGSSASNILASSMMANTGCILEASQYLLHGTSPARNGSAYPVRRPLQRDIWQRGKDGYLVNDTRQEEVGCLASMMPTIWLKQFEENMYPFIYQHKSLTIVVLVPVCSLINGDQGLNMVKQQILENAYQKIVTVEGKLSRGWGGGNSYHVSGYRYLMLNTDLKLSRSSPPGKVATLTKDTLLALNKLREEVDLEKRTKCDDTEGEKDLEVCIRAKNNAWVIARVFRGRELYMALEKANETLLYASEAVEKFTTRYNEGAFSLD